MKFSGFNNPVDYKNPNESVSRPMLPFLIYLFPFMMDIMLSMAFFVNPVRAAMLGAGPHIVAGQLFAAQSVGMVAGITVSRFLSHTNARRLLLVGCSWTALVSFMFPLFPSVPMMFVLIGALIIGTVMFFSSFQVLMKEAMGGQAGVVTAAAVYVFAWSLGFSLGPFIAGFLMEDYNAWQLCYIIGGGLSAVTALGFLLLFPHLARRSRELAKSASAPPVNVYADRPDIVAVGWSCGLVVVLISAFIGSNFPSHAAALDFEEKNIGYVMFAIRVTQSLTGLSLIFSRFWMYNPLRLAGVSASGIIGLLLFTFGRELAHFIVGGMFIGAFAGCGFFLFAFHSIVHPTRTPRYVAINEFTIGLGAISGSLLGMSMIFFRPHYGVLYPVCIVIIAAFLVYQITQIQRSKAFFSGANL